MTDEAAGSRRPATTGTGPSQDAPAPSAAAPAAAASDDPTPIDAPGTGEEPARVGAATPSDEPTRVDATAASDEPTRVDAPAASDEPTRVDAPAASEEPATERIDDQPTVPVPPAPEAYVPPAPDAPPTPDAPDAPPTPDAPPAPEAPPAAEMPPPPPGAGTGAGTGAGSQPPPAGPPPWFGAGTWSGFGSGASTFLNRDQLVRPAEGRYLAGVCAAIGRATNTDPVLWRVVLAVLGFFGGVGVLLYLLGWLLIPSEGDTASPIESLLGRGRSGMTPFAVVLLGVATALTFAFIVHDGFRAALLAGAVLVGGAMLLKRNNAQNTGATTPPSAAPGEDATFPSADPAGAYAAASPAPAAASPTGAPAAEPLTSPLPPRPPADEPGPAYAPPPWTPPQGGYRPPFAPHGPFASATPYQNLAPAKPPKAPKPPRERSKLGRITFFATVLVLGLLALLDLAGVSVSAGAYFAAALATIGLGLVVGAWFGRARGLIALALIVTAGLGISTAAERWGGPLDNPVYRPQSIEAVADRYDFTIGDTTLDLRAVDFTGQTQNTIVEMGAGQLKVLLPDTVDATTTVSLDRGRALVLGKEWNGNDLGTQVVTDLGPDGAGGGALHLTIQMNTGNVEVVR